MPCLNKRGGQYRIIFSYNNKKYSRTLKTAVESEALQADSRVKETLRLIHLGRLSVPANCDFGDFVLSEGKQTARAQAPVGLTLDQLEARYKEAHSAGLEATTLATFTTHFRKLRKTLGSTKNLHGLQLLDLQEHINQRSKDKGTNGRRVSAVTIRKELASLRAAWNWAVQASLLKGTLPSEGLRFPKTEEKPAFQTFAEIERQIKAGGLTTAQQKDLWDCLYLDIDQVKAMLAFVKVHASQSFIYPMFYFAAYTGARRSEILRMRVADIDLDNGIVSLREKKKTKGRTTMRQVQLEGSLVKVLREWLSVHPGGPHAFGQPKQVAHSRKRRTEVTAVTRDEAHDHFKRTLAGSPKWSKLRGWHVLRHSFASNCAAKGLDQRMIDEWLGHTTEDMRKRYRHLFPSNQKAAIASVFG